MDKHNLAILCRCATLILFLYTLFCILSIYLFWEEQDDSEVLFIIIIVSVALICFLFTYVFECFNKNNTETMSWHRQMEYIPITFFFFFTAGLFLITLLVLLHQNGISFTQAFSNLTLVTWWIFIIFFVIYFVFFIATANLTIQHRNNSVVCFDQNQP